MNIPTKSTLSAKQRSFAYGLMAATFDYPDKEFTELIHNKQLSDQCKTILCDIYPALKEDIDWTLLTTQDDKETLQVEFSRLFDVGASGPPCPLNGGVYLEERMQTLEEMVRFYNYFGLTAGEDFEELPDHITTQLEFMHFLCHCEDEHQDDPEKANHFQRAQRDFINRHLGKWVPQLNDNVQENQAAPFYLTLIDMVTRYILLEKQYVNNLCGMITVN